MHSSQPNNQAACRDLSMYFVEERYEKIGKYNSWLEFMHCLRLKWEKIEWTREKWLLIFGCAFFFVLCMRGKCSTFVSWLRRPMARKNSHSSTSLRVCCLCIRRDEKVSPSTDIRQADRQTDTFGQSKWSFYHRNAFVSFNEIIVISTLFVWRLRPFSALV